MTPWGPCHHGALHPTMLSRRACPWLQGAAGGSSSIPHTPAGLAYPFHYGALRPAMATAFLGLIFANQTTDAAYSGRLFNYAAYQVSCATLTAASGVTLAYACYCCSTWLGLPEGSVCGCHLVQDTTSTCETSWHAHSMVGGGAAAIAH